MKKILLYVAAVLVAALPAIHAGAQQANADAIPTYKGGPHSFIGITGGLSAPMGNVAKGDYLDNTSGYTGAGGNIGITGVYFIDHSRFGITALASYQAFGFKGTQSLADGYKDGYSLDSTTLYTNSSNHAFNLFIGPYYSIPVANHFTVDVRAMGGLTSAHRAGYRVAFEDADYDVVQLQSSASTFGFQLGIAPHYDFSKHLSLMLNLDYFRAKPTFDVNYTSFHPSTNGEAAGISNQPINKMLPTSYSQALQGINTNLTLCFRL